MLVQRTKGDDLMNPRTTACYRSCFLIQSPSHCRFCPCSYSTGVAQTPFPSQARLSAVLQVSQRFPVSERRFHKEYSNAIHILIRLNLSRNVAIQAWAVMDGESINLAACALHDPRESSEIFHDFPTKCFSILCSYCYFFSSIIRLKRVSGAM